MGSKGCSIPRLFYSTFVSISNSSLAYLTRFSLSEYGCNTNTRKFEEVASLYSTNMTGVYSGGLVYEYAQETSNYGLVSISGNDVTELPDFDALQTAYTATPNPSGDGGYSASGSASQCPPMQEPEWAVGTTLLPPLPADAQKYFTSGAGTAPGLSSKTGSQNSGTTFAFSAASGGSAGTTNGAFNGTAVNGTGSGSTKPGAASGLRIPVEAGAFMVAAGLFAVMAL
jgi:hypothetical protein